jgi:hypothetical protein
MHPTEIWRGLEREVRAIASCAAFELARERHEALRPYADLSTAAAAAQGRCEQRDAIVAALVAEHHATGASPWSAAVILAMAPLLRSVARVLRDMSVDAVDAEPSVLMAFLEAVSQITTSDRIALRLYSETRRRVLRSRRATLEDVCRVSLDVDAVAHGGASIEGRLDEARFVLRARVLAPEPGETPVAYLERLAPSPSQRERRGRHALLKSHRTASLAALREAFRSIPATQPDGDTR